MKKILKDIDKKLIISLLIIISLLSTVAAYEIYATITAEMESRGSEENAVGPDGRYFSAADLKSKYDILCCYHGGEDAHLPGENATTLVAGGSSTRTTDSGKEIGKLVKGDEGETALTVTEAEIEEDSPYTKSSYRAETYAFYHVKSTEIARPKEAYILAEMIEETNGGAVFYEDGYSSIQYAWWTTEAGSKGMIVPPDNSLALEATAFEAYIGKLGSTDPNTFVEQHYDFDVNGNRHEGDVPAPVLTYEPTWNEDANLDGVVNEHDEVTTSWDGTFGKQAYTVGPFSIDYVEESYSAADRPEVVFAGIIDSKLYTNLGEVPADKWRFNFIKDERDTADTFEFPHANEVFYVELDYIEGATEITNLHFDFKYMNAGGKYDSLEGTYFVETWTPDSKVAETCDGGCGHSSHDEDSTCDGLCSHGYSSSHPTKWQYWLELTGMEEKTAQLLAYGIIGARWYNYAELDTDVPPPPDERQGQFKIVKQIVDANGNVIDSEDRTKKFTFEIYKDGHLYDTVIVRPNSAYTSSVLTWKADEPTPKIEVVEVLNDGEYKQYGPIEVTGSLEDKTLTFTAKNTAIEKEGKISITKRQIGSGLEGEVFSFKLYIDNKVYVNEPQTSSDGTITIGLDETWTSDTIKWTGNSPSYKVREINLPEDAELVKIENGTGTLLEGKTVNVIAINRLGITEYDRGTLSIKKVLDGNVSSEKTFEFTIKVGNDTFTKKLKAGQTWSETFVWKKGEKAPDYEVLEVNIPEDYQLVEIKNGKGTLSPNGAVSEVICINEVTKEHEGKISIHKETISDDKEGVDENSDVFTFETRISGTFELDGESVVNGSRTLSATLKADQTWTSPVVTWKGEAPTYTVTETSLPEGWKLDSITNASGSLKDGATIEVNCVNRYKITVEYDLTMEMAGLVWEDAPLNEEDKNTEDSKANGKYDNGENGIEKAEVIIWKKLYDASGNEIVGLRKYATGYEEGSNTIIDFPLYTNVDGYWEAPRMSVPGLLEDEKAAGAVRADYDVEFIYDGQTYKPTDFLVSGNVAHFRKASNADKSQYLNDSMAYEVESERAAFDSKFEVITGDTPIDDNGTTTGYATNGNGQVTVEELLYYSTDSLPSVDNNTRKISELQTTDDGYVREPYKMSSRTSTGGLTYPFDDRVHLENVKKILDKIEGGTIIRYEYSATYPYLLNVNLGLVRRDEAELAVTKDVHSAAVVVNQKLLNYKYNEYVDFETEEYQEYLNLQLKLADADISYKLDLYESDYYYRAKVYEENSEVQGALEEFYRSIGKTDLSDELDLDVFLTYKISVYNNSDSYLAQIRNLVDYFDEDLELVSAEQTKYIQEANGISVDSTTVVAEPAYVIKKGPTESSMWGEITNKSIAGSVTADYSRLYNSSSVDSELSTNTGMEVSENVREENLKRYYRADINLEDPDFRLAVGEKLEVYLTFKVRTDEAPARFENEGLVEETQSYIRLGTKANVAEIGAYSTYYIEGNIAGRVDKDSAPGNVDIENKNEKSWYEDDTDSAPIITLDLYDETRNVNGFAWEDEETETIDYNQIVGNGIYDDGERKIGNLTTQMVEKVRVKQSDGTYREYDFVWPTGKTYAFLNNKTLQEITGFDSITLTSNAPENTGDYNFINIPAGNYVVRFVYGYFPSDTMDANGNLVKLDGVSEPKTSDDNSRKPAVYNGQDFKTTAYQADNVGEDGKLAHTANANGYIDNEWYDFATCKYDENGNIISHNSDAIDNEARRLEVIAYSKVLNNEITTVLATANDYTADHTELYNNTAMFADTAKINLNIENMTSLEGQRITVTNAKTGQTEEVYAGEELTHNGLISNYVYGKSDVDGDKGTVNLINYAYNIEAVDVGIEERSNTELVLDKEIESITLKTNTGDPILKAVYDISYEYVIDDTTGKTSYKAIVELNEEASFGTENLIAQNKDEEAGLQNFRYIYYDDTIAQGLNLEVVYKLSALNLGEVDRTGKVSEFATVEEILAKANELKPQVYVKEGNTLRNVNHPNVGEYIGSIYYIGKQDAYTQNDTIVKTKVRQLIDYVDNDAVFKGAENTALNGSWKSTTAQELLDNKVITASLIEEYDGVKNIVDDRNVLYTTAERNNIVLSVDGTEGDKLANPEFIVDMVPYAASKENADTTDVSCIVSMNLVMTRSIDTQIDDEDLSYDNIAEIVRFENTVGKRDIETIAGNAEPKLGEFTTSLDERDASATELITFTPPTGLGLQNSMKLEIVIVTLVALVIVLIGVVIIKKTVLKK